MHNHTEQEAYQDGFNAGKYGTAERPPNDFDRDLSAAWNDGYYEGRQEIYRVLW